MEIRTGIDIVEVPRIQHAIEKTGTRFLDSIYTEEEQRYCEERGSHRFESYAACFAAKEAVAKALGTGLGEIGHKDIGVCHDERRKPLVQLTGKAQMHFVKIGGTSLDISLSHTQENAIAVAMLLCSPSH